MIPLGLSPWPRGPEAAHWRNELAGSQPPRSRGGAWSEPLKLNIDAMDFRREKPPLSVTASLAHGVHDDSVFGTYLRTYSCRKERGDSLPTTCAFDSLGMLSVPLLGAHGLSWER